MDHILAQPYYGDKKVRFYNTLNPVPASPALTLDVSNDITTNWGSSFGANSVVIHNTKIFVSVANGNQGGVLIYDYPDIYPTRNANPPAVLKGLPSAGLAVNPANGDLYVPTFHTAGNNGGIVIYTAASNYKTAVAFCDFSDDSVAQICANLAFDAKGNLWMTTWTADNDPTHHFLICYKGINKANFYKIANTATKSYTATSFSGATINVHLLSAPEGIAFDPAGNLWLGNNNDDVLTNNPGEGTLVKITASWIATLLSGLPAGPNGDHTFTVPAAQADIKYIPGGKLGGIEFDGSNIYINDQGQNQGSDYLNNGTVWTWDVNTAFSSTNFKASGIHTTYPGNGAGSFVQPAIYIADNTADTGKEPNTTITQPWQSLDIWVRKTADGTVTGNDATEDVTGGQTGYVYVRVRNLGMITSAGTEVVKLYWAKASAGLYWPAPWDGSVTEVGSGAILGGPVSPATGKTIPGVSPAGSQIVEFSWTTPNPEDYVNKEGHFCLLARIESATTYPFGMTYPEVTNQIVINALNNNRIGWRNIHIVNPVTNKIKIGGGVIVANYTDKAMRVQLAFEVLDAKGRVTDLAGGRLLVRATGTALEKLNQTEFDRHAVESLGNGLFQVNDPKKGIENIMLQPGEMLHIDAGYEPIQTVSGGALRVIQNQQDGTSTQLIGGQTFVYGKTKGFGIATKKTGPSSWWICILITMFILFVVSLAGGKKKHEDD